MYILNNKETYFKSLIIIIMFLYFFIKIIKVCYYINSFLLIAVLLEKVFI